MGKLYPGPNRSPIVIAQSAVAVTAPLDTAENILATVTIPAGLMGVNSSLRINVMFSWTNSANIKMPRIRLGGIGGTAFLAITAGSGSSVLQTVTLIRNVNSLSVQKGYPSSVGTTNGYSTATLVSGAINTGAAQDLVFTGTKATGAESFILESYCVEFLP